MSLNLSILAQVTPISPKLNRTNPAPSYDLKELHGTFDVCCLFYNGLWIKDNPPPPPRYRVKNIILFTGFYIFYFLYCLFWVNNVVLINDNFVGISRPRASESYASVCVSVSHAWWIGIKVNPLGVYSKGHKSALSTGTAAQYKQMILKSEGNELKLIQIRITIRIL